MRNIKICIRTLWPLPLAGQSNNPASLECWLHGGPVARKHTWEGSPLCLKSSWTLIGLYCSLTVGVLKKKKKKTSPSTSSLFLSVTDRKFTNYVSTQWMKQIKLYHPNAKVPSDIRRERGVGLTVPSKDRQLLCDVVPDSPCRWGPARCTVPHVGVPLDVQVVEVVSVFHLASFGTLQPLDDLSFHLHGYVSWQQGKQKALLRGRGQRAEHFRQWWERLPGGEAMLLWWKKTVTLPEVRPYHYILIYWTLNKSFPHG